LVIIPDSAEQRYLPQEAAAVVAAAVVVAVAAVVFLPLAGS
jgi:hypothetical protein